MLSKNNLRELLNKQRPRKQRFTIKKLTIGVASVLLGFTFMGVNASADANQSTVNTGVATTALTNNQQATQPAATQSTANTQTTQSASTQTDTNTPSTANNSNTTTVNVKGLTNQNTDPSTIITNLSEQTDSEKYQPAGTTGVINYIYSGETISGYDATNFVSWPNGTPSDGTPLYSWNNPNQVVDTIGDYPADVNVTYVDGSSTIVHSVVQVRHFPATSDKDLEKYAPTGATLSLNVNASVPSAKSAISNASTLPTGTTFDWYYPLSTATAGNNYEVVKVTYPDASYNLVPVMVNVTAPSEKEDYQPSYDDILNGYNYEYTTVTPTWSTENGNQGKPANATFSAVSGENGTPSWVTVKADGTLAISIPYDTPIDSSYNVPVSVTYSDGSSETVYINIKVPRTVDASYLWDVFNVATHKTSGESAPITLPDWQTITFAHFDPSTSDFSLSNAIDSITYKNEKNKLVAITSLFDQHGRHILLANGQEAPQEIDVSENELVKDFNWTSGHAPSTNVSEFYGNTATESREDDFDVTETSSSTLNQYFLASPKYNNTLKSSTKFIFYGAVTGSPLTFYQNTDISNLSQEQYRTLIDVSDLGANGWGGTNVNANAPLVLAYLPGSDSSKTFYMTWAPNGKPSTATVQNGVAGTVRIHFSDGTYLDVPATINVIAKSTQPVDQTFTQKIVYTYNGKEVWTTSIDKIKKGDSLTADTLKTTIDGNVPGDYTIKTGYTYPSTRSNITSTPAVIYVPLTLNSGAEQQLNLSGKLVYKKADGTTFSNGATTIDGTQFKSKKDDILTAALLKDYADQGMQSIVALKNYVISQYPASYQVENDGFTITVLVKDGSRIVNPGDNDQSSDQFTTSTRTIKYIVPAGHAVIADGTQTAYFERAKLIDAVTGAVETNFTGDFDGVHFTNGYAAWDPSDGTWEKYDVEQIPNYDSYVEGVKSTSVAEDDYVPAGYDTTVHVTYTDQLVPVTPGNPGVTPDNPEYKNLFHTVTRKIIVNNPVTGHQDVTNQTVVFGRTGLYDKTTGKFVDNGYGNWHVYQNGKLTTDSTGNWPGFTAPKFSGWTPDRSEVDPKVVTEDMPDETVVISYTSNSQPGKPGTPGQPGTPGTPGNPGTPGVPGSTPGANGNPASQTGTPAGTTSTVTGQPQGQTSQSEFSAAGQAQLAALQKAQAKAQQQAAAKQLPQTGNEQQSGLIGLALAGIASELGFGLKKRKQD